MLALTLSVSTVAIQQYRWIYASRSHTHAHYYRSRIAMYTFERSENEQKARRETQGTRASNGLNDINYRSVDLRLSFMRIGTCGNHAYFFVPFSLIPMLGRPLGKKMFTSEMHAKAYFWVGWENFISRIWNNKSKIRSYNNILCLLCMFANDFLSKERNARINR